MSTGPFTQHVSGFTSDHTYQTATAVSYAKDGTTLTLTGLTWNLLNLAHSKRDNFPHRNNPFDADETQADYDIRKNDQIKFLWKQIKDGRIDFMVLQEVDMFTQDPLPAYVKDFLEKIRAQGWFTVHTDKSDEVRMPLLTLYNTQKLRFVDKRAILPGHHQRKAALEATFSYLGTSAEVCITNVHLDFETDHRAAILEYQQQQINLGKFTIMGGDAMHAPDKEHYSLVGDLDMPTNISVPAPGQVASDDGGKILQRFDGFMVGPANPKARVEITEGPGAYFSWVPANSLLRSFKKIQDPEAVAGKYVCKTFDPKHERATHMVHMSLPGLPWIREKYKHLLVSQI